MVTGRVSNVILSAAKESNADLIVMGTQSRRGLLRLLLAVWPNRSYATPNVRSYGQAGFRDHHRILTEGRTLTGFD
jgi:hypothetical protein